MITGATLTPPPVALVANDQEWSARSLESILAPNGFAVVRAATADEAIELALSVQPDVVIVDHKVPGFDGIAVCRRLQAESRLGAATPIMLTTTSAAPRALRLEAYDAGVWDFCTFPLDGEMLLLKLRTFVRVKRAMDSVREQTLLDELTGLYNMRGLARRAREIGGEAYRRRGALACVAIAPEVQGEPGDGAEPAESALVRYLAEVCRRTGRASDAIGRTGRAELAIVAPSTAADGVMRLLERLRESIHEVPLADERVQRVRLRAGYCAAEDYAQSPVDAVEMLVRATTALRHARAAAEGDVVRAYDDLPGSADS